MEIAPSNNIEREMANAKSWRSVVDPDGKLRCSCGRELVKMDDTTYRCSAGYPVYRFEDGTFIIDKFGNLLIKTEMPHDPPAGGEKKEVKP